MMFLGILLGLCCFHQASGGTHTLQYFYTVSSGISNFPEFVDVGVVDGVPISRYDSDTQRKVPLQKWMAENLDQQYWDRYTEILRGTEQTMKVDIQTLKGRFNQTGGVHSLQYMYGCQWDEESGTIGGFEQYGYDGEDFVYFDLKNLRFIATTREGLRTKLNWESNSVFLTQEKQYLTQTCIEWLKKYVQYGSRTLDRKVPPEVTLLQKDSEVVCHSTGFYPEGVMITWKKDGREVQEDVDVRETLPNEDGTFQKKVVLTVSPEERRKGQYTCEVVHKSGAPVVKTLVVEDGNTLGIIIGCVIAALVVIGVIAVVIVMMKKKDYKKADQSDTDSDASNPPRHELIW